MPSDIDDLPTDVRVALAILQTEQTAIKSDVKAIKGAMFFVVASIVGGFIVALIAVVAGRIT